MLAGVIAENIAATRGRCIAPGVGGLHEARPIFRHRDGYTARKLLRGMVALGATEVSLLERETELGELAGAIRASATRGRVLVISGPSGCGKTALLQAALRSALEIEMDVHVARASELEQGFAFGGVRQLLEHPVERLESAGRLSLTGAAARGWAAIRPGETAPDGDAFAALHDLYWLLARLLERGPAVLGVDDAQWLDAASLRWLEYVSHRIGDLPVLLVLAMWKPDPDTPVELRRLLTDPDVSHLRPGPLSRAAIAQMLEQRLEVTPESGFVLACEQATAGNAFLVRELAESLASDGVVPCDAVVDQLTRRAPETVRQSLLLRLDRLGPQARAVARALAVCGDGPPVQTLAAIAELSIEATSFALDSLAAAELVAAGRPPDFIHGLVRSAVLAELTAGESSELHRRCAEALNASGADPEMIAVHWIEADPAADAAVVAHLREAAGRAIARGGPESAVRYLRRALRECPQPPAGLTHELGRAELLARDPGCVDRLQAALAEETDPHRRAAVGIDAADALMFAGRWHESIELAYSLRADLLEEDPLSLSFDEFIAASLLDGSERERPSDLERLRNRAARPDVSARALCMRLACVIAVRGGSAEEVVELVDRGYGGGGFFDRGSPDSSALVNGVMALLFVGRYDAARSVSEGILADARRRGLVLGHVAGATHRGLVSQRSGELREAEADLRDAFELALEHELLFTLPFIVGYLASTLLDRGQLESALDVIGSIDPPGPDTIKPGAAAFYEARGAVRAATGDRDGALADLHEAGLAALAMRTTNPLANRWRSRAALILGTGPEAIGLARGELEQADATGVAIGIGITTHALALIDDPAHRESRLRRAIDLLADSPARLEHARSRIDLGTVLRLRGEREEARRHLRVGLDLADRSGATLLAERARSEAIAAGIRPRRPRLGGLEALTPAELRVARLASQGLTNNQIAQALFITTGTVKDHLGSAYRKLEISSRGELSDALQPPQTDV